MLVSIFAGEAASIMCPAASRFAYTIFSAIMPYLLYVCYGGKISFKVRKISYTIIVTAILLWAGGNLLNSVFNMGLEKIGILPITQLEPEENTYQTVMNIVCACIAAPICEEFVYRGIILKSAYVYGEGAAVLISALLFAFAHGSITVLAMPFLYGIVCGIIVVKTGNLAASMLIHCICNTLSYVITKTEFSGAAAITAVVGTIYIVCLSVLAVKKHKKVKSALCGLFQSIDFWWIPVFIKAVLSNIIYHGG